MKSLCEVAASLQIPCEIDTPLTGVSIDSRSVKPGALFVALRGDRFDGHAFIQEAIAKGAAAVLCSEAIKLNVPFLRVPDSLVALTQMASAYRQTLACEVIALTGSNGKTTVKEMIAAILPPPSFKTPGNLNNHIGVPLSVLRVQPEDRYAVFELGANHPGEIAHTVAIVRPDVALINNIAPAHIGEFGSIEEVARAKGEIYQGLGVSGTAIVNDDDLFAHAWDAPLRSKHTVRFSVDHSAAVQAKDRIFTEEGCAHFRLVLPEGEADVALRVVGAHQVRNALAAAACTDALGIPITTIVSGLERFSGVSGRMSFLAGKNNSVVIDDTYNANLRSSLAALDVLAARSGRRIFVFGDMGELGSWCLAHHQEVGSAARDHGIEALMTCGVASEETVKAFGSAGKHYRDHDDLISDLLGQLNEQTTVLVKGSRSSRMEKIVQQLLR